MKKLILAVMLTITSIGAQAQLAMPGSNWTELTYNPSPIKGTVEDNNIVVQGALQQGIDWTKLGAWTLNTSVGVNYVADRNGLSYNNKISPLIGIKLRRDFASGSVDVGIRVVHQINFSGVSPGQPKSGTGVQVYAGYWFGWNLKK